VHERCDLSLPSIAQAFGESLVNLQWGLLLHERTSALNSLTLDDAMATEFSLHCVLFMDQLVQNCGNPLYVRHYMWHARGCEECA